MAWKKANKSLIKLLEENMVKYRCDRKMMFGAPTFFINNNMFAGVHEDKVILKLSDGDGAKILDLYKEVKAFEPMPGRIMKGYVALPESLCSDAGMFREWLERSYRYAATLPPKAPKSPKKK